MSDPTGNEYVGAKGISDSLATHGCLLGGYPTAQDNDISDNPVFDSARRFSRFYRVMRRQELLSYEVDTDGARLRFRRNAYGVQGADAWAGIAPPPHAIPSGELIVGEEYIVRGTTGGVSHGPSRYFTGDRFIAVNETYASDGDAEPWQYDGIRHTALKKGWTNEWVVWMVTHAFKEQYDSIWKPEVFADFFGWSEPALWMLPSADIALIRHANTTTAFSVDPVDGAATFEQELTRAQFLNPEAPTAYRYTLGVNSGASAAFKKSRPVYEKPMEIWSCTLEFSGPAQIVVVHLRERPRSHANAPATVDADTSTWSADDLARLDGTHATEPEDYRTPDNALREYLRWSTGDHHAPSLKVGDHAYAATLSPTSWGNVMPTFHLLKLIPESYEDENGTLDASDSRMLAETHQQAEWYLRAMCEGYVDGATSAERTCRNASDAGLYEFTWENVCFQSHSGRDCGPFPVSVRDDRPSGFGPLPNTVTYAQTHNNLAGVANLLTKLRLDVPLEWSTRTYTYHGWRDLGLDPIDWGYCTDTTFQVWKDNAKPPDAFTLTSDTGWTPWSPGTSVILGLQSMSLGCAPDASNEWWAENVRTDTDWRVQISSAWLDAVPVELQDLINVGSFGTVAEKIEARQRSKRLDEDPRTTCGAPIPTPSSWKWDQEYLSYVRSCEVLTPGVVSAPKPPPSDIGNFRPTGKDPCSWGALHSVEYGPLAYPGAYVEVPLAPLP